MYTSCIFLYATYPLKDLLVEVFLTSFACSVGSTYNGNVITGGSCPWSPDHTMSLSPYGLLTPKITWSIISHHPLRSPQTMEISSQTKFSLPFRRFCHLASLVSVNDRLFMCLTGRGKLLCQVPPHKTSVTHSVKVSNTILSSKIVSSTMCFPGTRCTVEKNGSTFTPFIFSHD